MGNEVLHGWARRQQEKKEDEYNRQPGVNRKKKNVLLVHATRNRHGRRTDLQSRTGRAADSTFCGIGGGEMSRVFGRYAASHE